MARVVSGPNNIVNITKNPRQDYFMPQIDAYDGDPSTLKFFISQILDIQKINK